MKKTLLGILISSAFCMQAQAATITVNTTSDSLSKMDGKCSLREAIISANKDSATTGNCTAGSGDDTISLSSGTYTLSLTGTGEDSTLKGDLDISSNITIQGRGATSTTINANSIDRVFHVVSGALTLKSVKVTGGSVDGNGGGIYSPSSTLTLSSATVSANKIGGGTSLPRTSYDGAGIYANAVTAVDSEISSNSMSAGRFEGHGAGIWAHTVDLENTPVSSNSITSTADALGGGVYISSGSLSCSDSCSVKSNSLSSTEGEAHGGGIFVTGSTVNINDGNINGNKAISYSLSSGGGIYVEESSSFELEESYVASNKAYAYDGSIVSSEEARGAGIALVDVEDITLQETRVSSNTLSGAVSNYGVGLYVLSEAADVDIEAYKLSVDANIVSSTARYGSGAGIYLKKDGGSLSMKLGNGTIYNNVTNAYDGGSGGGLYSNEADVTLYHTTVASNQAEGGSGVQNYSSSGGMTFYYSAIGDNISTNKYGPQDCGGVMTGGDYNLIENTYGCDVDALSNTIEEDPFINHYSDGPTYVSLIPLEGSPLIDAVTTDSTTVFMGEWAEDILGQDRLYDGDADGTPYNDIGSFEYQGHS